MLQEAPVPPYLRGLGLDVIPLWESDMGAGLRKMIRGSAGAMGQRLLGQRGGRSRGAEAGAVRLGCCGHHGKEPGAKYI